MRPSLVFLERLGGFEKLMNRKIPRDIFGQCKQYLSRISGYAGIIEPLRRLANLKVDFERTVNHDTAWELSKTTMSKAYGVLFAKGDLVQLLWMCLRSYH